MFRSRFGNLLTAAVLTFLPLLGARDRLLHPGPWLAFIAAAMILLSQPPVNPKEMVTTKADRRSALSIFAAMIATQVTALLQFGYRAEFAPAPLSSAVFVGVLVSVGGLALRLWSIRVLGAFFTSTVHVQKGQTVVDTGPYRYLRHPSYTGALLSVLGVTVALWSPVGMLLIALLVVPAYLYRIRTEEVTLVAQLGDAYERYRTRTWRLIPFLF